MEDRESLQHLREEIIADVNRKKELNHKHENIDPLYGLIAISVVMVAAKIFGVM